MRSLRTDDIPGAKPRDYARKRESSLPLAISPITGIYPEIKGKSPYPQKNIANNAIDNYVQELNEYEGNNK